MNITSLRVGIQLLATVALLPDIGAAESKFSWRTNEHSTALVHEGKSVWEFQHGTNSASKPYFHPMALPGGSPLTWQKPADHVWHYGLWFSWKFLNGINYWEENKQGESDGVTSWRVVKLETRPDFSAQIVLAVDYRARGAAKPLLTEHRSITISAPAADGSYFMDWRLQFKSEGDAVKFDRTPLIHEPGGKSYGGYAGLSWRFARELADVQVASTSDTGKPEDNRYRFPAASVDYSGRLDGAEVGVSLLDHPSNLRHPTRWYAIINSAQRFWFLNAAWIQRELFELPANESFTLRYRVVVHPGRWDATQLAAEEKKYAAESAKP